MARIEIRRVSPDHVGRAGGAFPLPHPLKPRAEFPQAPYIGRGSHRWRPRLRRDSVRSCLELHGACRYWSGADCVPSVWLTSFVACCLSSMRRRNVRRYRCMSSSRAAQAARFMARRSPRVCSGAGRIEASAASSLMRCKLLSKSACVGWRGGLRCLSVRRRFSREGRIVDYLNERCA